MQVTTLLGSAKKKGNTATVLGWVEENLKSLGHDVERIYLNSKSIRGCLGCAKCRENPDEIACVQKDDAIDIMEDAIQFLKAKKKEEPESRARAEFQEVRVRELLDLARFGKQLLDTLIKDAKVDGSPLMNVLLGGSAKR